MKSWSCQLSCIAVLVLSDLLSQGCSQRESQISGQVFIVTAGGDSKKMGDLEVRVYTEEGIAEFDGKVAAYLKDMGRKAEEAKPALKRCEDAIQEAEEAMGKYTVRLYELSVEIDHAEADQRKHESYVADSFLEPERVFWADSIKKDVERATSLRTQRAKLEDEKRDFASKLDQLKDAKQRLLSAVKVPTDCEDYFLLLGLPLKSVRTNAEGDFSFRVNPRRRYAIAAHGQRQTALGIERYFWLLWIDPRERDYPRVLLTNSNMLKEAPNCFLHLESVRFLE